MTQDQKNKRMDYLQAVLYKYAETEPKLTMEEFAYAICEQFNSEQLVEFIKKFKKELKK